MNTNWVNRLLEEEQPSTIKDYYYKVIDFIDYRISSPITHLMCKLRYIYKNIKFFMPHIIKMRDWDSSYQIELFADSLEYLAKGLKRHNHLVNSIKYYRRCMTAAGQLRRAYNFESYRDKSYRQLSDNNPIRFIRCGGYSQMTHDYSAKGKEYYEKMYKLINKRLTKKEKEAKQEAWAYIAKHIECFWD